MPIIGSFGAGSKGGYGRGGAAKYDIDYLIVAGGGASSLNNGGGGGAGGARYFTGTEVTGGQTFTITVGAGGTTPSYVLADGDDSSISGGDLGTITSTGGGSGSQIPDPGNQGGSGGGAAGEVSSPAA